MKTKKDSRTKGIVVSYIYFIANTIFSVVISAFIVRTVGKANYGVYQSVTAFITYLVLLEFGMSTLMARNILLVRNKNNDIDEINKNVSTIWTSTIILSAIILALLFVFYLLIPFIYSSSFSIEQIYLGKKIFIFAGLNLLFNFFSSTLNGLILAYEKYSFEKIISLIKLLLRCLLVFVILSIKSSVVIVVIIDMSISFVFLVYTFVYCIKKFKAKLNFKYFDKTIVRVCLPLAFAMLIQGAVNVANTVVDKFLISILMTPEDVSVYSITMLIFTLFSSLGTLPNTLFMPSIASNVSKELDKTDFTKTLVQPCRLNVLIIGFAGLIYFLIGQHFICVVYGIDYADAWIYSLIILIPLFFYLTNAIMAHVLTLYNKRQVMSYISLLATSINVILTIFAIKYFGMAGAAASTAISLVIQVVLLNLYYSKKMKIKIVLLFKETYKGIVPSLFLSFIFALPFAFKDSGNVMWRIIGVCVFVVMFIVTSIVFGFNDREKRMIRKIIKKRNNTKKEG